jgi:predicted membrane protein
MERTGEKIGWTGGWLGAFSWLLIMSIILLVRGNYNFGIAGLVLFVIALFLINLMSPWRQPEVKYWVLFTPLYIILIIAMIMMITAYEGWFRAGRFNSFCFTWMLPLLVPYFVIGQKTWNSQKGNN